MAGLAVAAVLIVLAGGLAVSTAAPASPSMAHAPSRRRAGRSIAEAEVGPAAGLATDPDALDLAELGAIDPGSGHHRVVSTLRLAVTIAFLGAAAGATTFLIGRSIVLLVRLIAGVDDSA